MLRQSDEPGTENEGVPNSHCDEQPRHRPIPAALAQPARGQRRQHETIEVSRGRADQRRHAEGVVAAAGADVRDDVAGLQLQGGDQPGGVFFLLALWPFQPVSDPLPEPSKLPFGSKFVEAPRADEPSIMSDARSVAKTIRVRIYPSP